MHILVLIDIQSRDIQSDAWKVSVKGYYLGCNITCPSDFELSETKKKLDSSDKCDPESKVAIQEIWSLVLDVLR